MENVPSITIAKIEYGRRPAATALNPKMDPESPVLLATLAIGWDEPDPREALARIEKTLLAFSPSFGRHECRGPMAYHVFASGNGSPRRGDASPNAGAPGAPGREPAAAPPLEGSLALAHLIEHAVIDFQCAILHNGRCSGVTGALREPPGWFDLMVECREFSVGRLCLNLAIAWVKAATLGRRLGAAEGDLLMAARSARAGASDSVTPSLVARGLGWSDSRAEQALKRLREAGYLDETPCTLNFSGIPAYRICTA